MNIKTVADAVTGTAAVLPWVKYALLLCDTKGKGTKGTWGRLDWYTQAR